jgi:hypothetical protein
VIPEGPSRSVPAETNVHWSRPGSSLCTPQANAQAQAAVIGSVSDYVKNLADLAKSLAGLSPATQAFLVSSVLFFMAVGLAVTDRLA